MIALIVIVLIVFICYIYFIYPFILYVLTRKKSHFEENEGAMLPSVSLIIAAYNEERIIGQKIENSLMLDYPKEKLEIIVASDCSTDRTNEIVRSYAAQGVKLSLQSEHKGKTSALNNTVPKTTGEIIVFSDANGIYRLDALQKLVRRFEDPTVGCVCGQLEYEQTDTSLVGGGESLYWRYEIMLKKNEGLFNSLVGANGSIYAIRKTLFSQLDEDMLDDLGIPLVIYSKGYRTIYEPDATSTEQLPGSLKIEFRKKIRIISRQLVTLWKLRGLWNPFRDVIGFQILSHKILRTLVPVFLLCIFFVSMFSDTLIIQIFFVLQLLFYVMAFCGLLFHAFSHKVILFLIPFYFCLVNFASLVAIIHFIRGKRYVIWETER